MNRKNCAVSLILVILMIICIFSAGCTYTTLEQQEKEYPIIGGWQTQITNIDGTSSTAILTANTNGTSYFMILGKNPNPDYAKTTKLSWVKKDDTTYELTSNTGEKYIGKYDLKNDTLSGKYNFTRMNPIVGIWTSIGTQPRSHFKATDIIRPDGTGKEIVSYPDGSVVINNITWKNTGDNAYEIRYNDGSIETFTLNKEKNSRVLNQVITKRKVFDNSSYYYAINGPWYNSEKQWAIVLNGDGSGYIKTPSVSYPLGWKLENNTTIKTEYLSGLDLDGHTLVGKTYTWTYDLDNNTITNSIGDVFIHPTENVPKLITYNSTTATKRVADCSLKPQGS